MEMASTLHIPEQWADLAISSWEGPILLLGGPGAGKSTLGQYLYRRLALQHDAVAYLDGDVGQQELGLPSTIGAALSSQENRAAFPPEGPSRTWFVGSNTPRGHFVPLLLGLHHLLKFTTQGGARATIIDTSGFIDAAQGAAVLKWAKVNLLKPAEIVAIQRADELEPILAPLRPLLGARLVVLKPSEKATPRTAQQRQAHRSTAYRAYFENAPAFDLPYRNLALFPDDRFVPGQLAALEDRDGFALALAVVVEANRSNQTVRLRCPWRADSSLAALRLGNLRLDLRQYQDEKL